MTNHSSILNRRTTLDQTLKKRAETQGKEIPCIFLSQERDVEYKLTYAELDLKARSVAGELQKLVSPGDRALLLYPTGPDFNVAFMACLYAGVIAVPVYPPRMQKKGNDPNVARLRSIIRDSEPGIALTESVLKNRVDQNFTEDFDFTRFPWLATDEVSVGSAASYHETRNDPESAAFLQYTSGSTGEPKGAIISHRALMHNQKLIAAGNAFRPGDVMVTWQPVYHDLGLCLAVMQPVYTGLLSVVMSPFLFLQSPWRWLQAISDYGGTTSGGPNFAYDYCAERISDEQAATLDLSRWRTAFNGAEPVHERSMARFAERFASAGFRYEAFCPCYGLAEATLGVTCKTDGTTMTILEVAAQDLQQGRAGAISEPGPASVRLISSGRACIDTILRIVDPETTEVRSENEIGEIWINSPSLASGYRGKDDLSRETFQAEIKGETGRGYLRSGDLGVIIDGELFVTGRLKDLIIVEGRNHYPQDLEKTIEEAGSALRKGSVVAFSIEAGEKEKVVLVAELERSARNADRNQLSLELKGAVSLRNQVQVSDIVFLRPGSLPRTSSGKVRRGACRRAYLEGTLKTI